MNEGMDIIRRVREQLFSGEKPLIKEIPHKRYVELKLGEDSLFEDLYALTSELVMKELSGPILDVLRRMKKAQKVKAADILKACSLIAACGTGKTGSSRGFVWPYLLKKTLDINYYDSGPIINELANRGYIERKEEDVQTKDSNLIRDFKGLTTRSAHYKTIRRATKKLYALLYYVLESREYFERKYICATVIYRKKDTAVLVQEHHRATDIEDDLKHLPGHQVPYYLPGPREVPQEDFFDEEKTRNFLKGYLEKTYDVEVVSVHEKKIDEDEWAHGLGIGKPNTRLRIRAYAVEIDKNWEFFVRTVEDPFPINDEEEKTRRQLNAMWMNIFDAIRRLPHIFSRDMVATYLLQLYGEESTSA